VKAATSSSPAALERRHRLESPGRARAERSTRTRVDRHLRDWASAGETLHAPALLRYEAANALTRAVAAGHLARDRVVTAWERITRVDVQLNTLADGAAAVETALRLERSNAYDAAYVVLAQTLDAELWTLDGPLARNARGLGLPVRLVPVDPH
jgi:predicted nucleic acid-binding protein